LQEIEIVQEDTADRQMRGRNRCNTPREGRASSIESIFVADEVRLPTLRLPTTIAPLRGFNALELKVVIDKL